MALDGHEGGFRLRVLFDPQTFLRQRTGGISRLFADLIKAFDQDPALGVEAVTAFTLSNNKHLSQVPDRGYLATPQWLPRGILYTSSWLTGLRRRPNLDLIHHTYYSGRFLDRRKSTLSVTTVYDMIPEMYAGSAGFTGSHLQKREYVSQCDLVICISESTRQDMEQVYGFAPRRTVVIPLAVDARFAPGLPPLGGLPSDYLLYVGSRIGYKNFSLLPEALQHVHSQGLDVPLVIVGKPLNRQEADRLRSLGLLSSCRVVQLNDDELVRAYANCLAVVQTSSYEGFGLTALEGMASGVPVIVSASSSMPEVCGDVALYFNPGHAIGLADQIVKVLADEDLRRDLSSRGVERSAQFSTARLAERTAAAYRELLESG